MKWGLSYFPPLTLIALRTVVGGAALLAAAPFLKNLGKYQAGDWKWFVFMGLCEPCLYYILEIYALIYTTATQAGTIAATIPILVALGAFFTLKERLTVYGWLGGGLAISGVIWLSLGAEATEAAPDPLWGNFLEFCAVICASIYFLCARRLSRHYKPFLITMIQTWIGTVFYLPILFMPGLGPPAGVPALAWISIVYLGLVVALGAYGSFNFGLSRTNAGNAAVYLNLIPIFALLMGAVFLGERLTLQQYPAGALILFGVYISNGAPGQGKTPGPGPAGS